jgi:hypothetical protein
VEAVVVAMAFLMQLDNQVVLVEEQVIGMPQVVRVIHLLQVHLKEIMVVIMVQLIHLLLEQLVEGVLVLLEKTLILQEVEMVE